jgi:tRNA wybutosine-synthesizing protein 3
MEYFDRSKRSVLEKLFKPDKSRKGGVDEMAVPVINALNEKKDFYTTSSCSGRISLFYESKSGKKHDSGWLFVKHNVVSLRELREPLESLPDESVWFRCEAPIFHVACRDLVAADKLLDICRALGFKRSGIIGNSRRKLVEIIFNDKMDVPVASNGIIFVDDKFLSFLVKKANEKFRKNLSLLKKFEKEIKKSI